MDEILATAAAPGIVVVEDAAQALGATYKGRPLGTIGHLGAFSFHVTKNLMCGQGGALVVNDERFAERAAVLADEGTDRERFVRGEVDKYSWNDVGSSFRASEIAAAFLWAQLEAAAAIDERRQAIYAYYQEALAPLAARGIVRLPATAPECRHNAHLFQLVLPDAKTCTALHAHLARHGIQAVRHYVPLHASPMGRRLGYRLGDLPVTEDVSERLLRLPIWVGLEPRDLDRIVAAIAAGL
jgi:dTDP-4-amino-4,6-dideoxygalactose transaminase